MLVYAKSPRGVLYLNGQPIHGCETGRDPVDIPFDVYVKCRDGLQDAAYREGTLTRMYGKQFPVIAFTYGELRFLPESTLDILGELMVSDYDVSWSHKKKVDQIKISLKDKSPCH